MSITPRDKTYYSFGRSLPESIKDSWFFNPKQSVFLNEVKKGLTNRQLAARFKTEEHVIEKHIRRLKDKGVLEDFKKLRPNLVKKYKDALTKVKKWAKDPTFKNWNKYFGANVPYEQVNKDVSRNIRAYFTGEKILRGTSSTIGGSEEVKRILKSLDIEKEIPKNAQNVLKTFTKDFFTANRANIGREVTVDNKLKNSFKKVIDINKEFKKNPNITLTQLTKNLYGNEFIKGNKETKLRLATTASDDVAKYLQALDGSRKVPKGMSAEWSPPTGEKLKNLMARIASQTDGFRFQGGTLRDYKFSIRDSLLKLAPNETKNLRRILSGTPGVIDEVAGLAATYKKAPGYTELMQLIPDETNIRKGVEIDRRFGPLLENALKGEFEGVDDFNKASQAFAKKYKIDTPLINRGGDPLKDILYFDKMSPEAQANVLKIADKGKGFTIKSTTLPIKAMGERFKEVQSSPDLYKKLIDAVDNAPQACRKILNYQTGGISTSCAVAIQEDPIGSANKLKDLKAESGPLVKFKNAASSFLNFAKRGGKYGAIAAAGAATAGLVKTFMNDDPTTYLSNEDQQKNMLISMVTNPIDETPEESPAILDYQLPTLGAVTAAGMVPGGAELYKARRAIRPDKLIGPMEKGVGPVRAALGLKGVLGKGLAATATPLGLLALEPLHLAGQIQSGDSLTDIATNPLNYLGPAFASGLTKEATRFASPMASKIMRMGMSPTALKGLSRAGGYGLLASLGIQGVMKYDDWRNKRGWFSEE